MKKIRVVLLVIFIFSLSMIAVQVKDKVKSEKVNEEISEIFYKDDMEEDKITQDKDDSDLMSEIIADEISRRDEIHRSIEAKEKIVLEEFKPLIEENDNTVGWLKIENTNIDYPVVQGDDNDFYLNHDFYDNKNSQGSIFMDFRNRGNLEDKHTIIYGHHMKNRTMFNDLNLYKDEEFFNENKTFTMKSLYGEETYEIFSTHVYENDPYIIKTRFNNDEFGSFIDSVKEKAEHEIDINVEESDDILTLITCAYDFKDARYVVHARKIK